MKSVLIIGGSGLVGSSLIRLASNNMNVFFTFCKNRYEASTSKSFFLDLLDKQNSAANLIKSLSPDVVVNTAAFQNVDYCELNHNMADQLHVKSTKEICSAVKFLITNKSITGQVIAIDSGQNLNWKTPDIIGTKE